MIDLFGDAAGASSWHFWAYLASDFVAGIAFVSNFLALFYVVHRRDNFRVSWFIPAFGLSLLACGVSFILLAVSSLMGIGSLLAVAKVMAALISAPVAVLAWPIAVHMVRGDSEPLIARADELERRIDELRDKLHGDINGSSR